MRKVGESDLNYFETLNKGGNVDKTYRVNVVFEFDDSDLTKALAWGRKNKYTYERDNEISDLLVNAALAGIVSPDIDDTTLLD